MCSPGFVSWARGVTPLGGRFWVCAPSHTRPCFRPCSISCSGYGPHPAPSTPARRRDTELTPPSRPRSRIAVGMRSAPAVCRNSGGQNAPSAVLTSRGHAAARRPADPSQARVAHRHHSPYAAAGSRRDMNERRAADLAPVVAVPGQISLPVEAGVPTPRSSSQSESSKRSSDTPRLAVTRAEAARALGMSVNSFERHVQPELRIVRRGKLRLIPVREIERWLEINAESTAERL